MKTEQFTEIVNNRINKCKAVRCDREKQYPTVDDRLYNFKRGSAIAGITPAQFAKSLLLDEFTTLLDVIDGKIVEDIIDIEVPLEDIIDEKMTNTHNYLYYIEALLKEQIKG